MLIEVRIVYRVNLGKNRVILSKNNVNRGKNHVIKV